MPKTARPQPLILVCLVGMIALPTAGALWFTQPLHRAAQATSAKQAPEVLHAGPDDVAQIGARPRHPEDAAARDLKANL